MKYLILPILKFIYSVLLTLIILFWDLIVIIPYFIWNLKIPNFNYYFWYTNGYIKSNNFSVYFIPKIGNDYIFKSEYHYIWNINPTIVE